MEENGLNQNLIRAIACGCATLVFISTIVVVIVMALQFQKKKRQKMSTATVQTTEEGSYHVLCRLTNNKSGAEDYQTSQVYESLASEGRNHVPNKNDLKIQSNAVSSPQGRVDNHPFNDSPSPRLYKYLVPVAGSGPVSSPGP